MSTLRRSVGANITFLLGANVASKALLAIFMIFSARYLGVGLFGSFNFSLALVLILSSVSSLGMQAILIREVARKKESTGAYFFNALIIRLLSSVLFTFILWAMVGTMDLDPGIAAGVRILGLFIFIEALSDTCGSIFQAHEKMDYVAYALFSKGAVVCLAGLVVFAGGYGFKGVVIAYIGGAAAGSLIALTIALTKFPLGPGLKIDLRLCRYLVKEALPLCVAVIFAVIYFRIDIIMLGFMKNDTVVGWYSSGFRLIEPLVFIPAAITGALLSAKSRIAEAGPGKLEKISNIEVKYLLFAGVPIVIGVVEIAGDLIQLIYGPAFLDSAPGFSVLVCAIPFIFVNYSLNATLVSMGKQRIVGVNAGLCVLVNILLNLALIPSFSFLGAAMATVLTELVLVVSNLYFCSRQIKMTLFFRELPLIFVCGIVMAGFLEVSGGLALPLRILVSCGIYLGAGFLLGVVNREGLASFND